MGHKRVNRIKEQKEKHRWSEQVMKKLLENDAMYTSDDAGGWHDKVDADVLKRK